jgi:chromosome partitioning protein
MDPKMSVAEAASFLGITLQAVHHRLKTKNLPVKKSKNRFYFGHETARQLFQINFNKKIIALQNVKGGVGKTEATVDIPIRAALYGARVLCIDEDMQGNLTDSFGIDADNLPVMVDIIKNKMPIEEAIINIMPGLDLIPSNIDNSVLDNVLMLGRHPLDRVYREMFDSLRDRYDLIFIDCPPALGQSVTATILAADEIIAPVTPDKRSIRGLKILTAELKNIEENFKRHVPLKVLFNKFDTRNNLSHEKYKELLTDPYYGSRLITRYIRDAQDFPKAIDKGHSIFDTFKTTYAKEDIDIVTQEILGIYTSPSSSK